MLFWLFYFLKGYVIIKVVGSFPEKFLNLASRQNVYIWDIEKKDEETLILKISVKGFFKLKNVAWKTGCRVSILRKSGAVFISKKYRKRNCFLIGILLFIATTVIFPMFLWEIDVTGNDRIPKELIYAQLSENGLKTGTPISKIDVDLITDKMEECNPDISWIIINIKGIKAKVEIRETTPVPEITDPNTPCNIVASKDGVIEDYYLRKGFKAAERGQTVKKGDLLISGVKEFTDGIKYENSDGDITIRVWYEQTFVQPLNISERVYTGKTQTRFFVNLFGNELNPMFFIKTYDDYDTDIVYLNPFIKKVTYKEVITKKKKLTHKEALEKGKNEIIKSVNSVMKDGKIDKAEYDCKDSGDELIINAEIETVEKAVEKVLINK